MNDSQKTGLENSLTELIAEAQVEKQNLLHEVHKLEHNIWIWQTKLLELQRERIMTANAQVSPKLASKIVEETNLTPDQISKGLKLLREQQVKPKTKDVQTAQDS